MARLQAVKALLISAACIGVAVLAFIDIAPRGRITTMDLEKLKWEAESYRRKHGHCAATLAFQHKGTECGTRMPLGGMPTADDQACVLQCIEAL